VVDNSEYIHIILGWTIHTGNGIAVWVGFIIKAYIQTKEQGNYWKQWL
jgi:hypothetical protein